MESEHFKYVIQKCKYKFNVDIPINLMNNNMKKDSLE